MDLKKFRVTLTYLESQSNLKFKRKRKTKTIHAIRISEVLDSMRQHFPWMLIRTVGIVIKEVK